MVLPRGHKGHWPGAVGSKCAASSLAAGLPDSLCHLRAGGQSWGGPRRREGPACTAVTVLCYAYYVPALTPSCVACSNRGG